MTTFLLTRHGMTDAVGRRITGWMSGVYLNEHGRQQVRELGAALKDVPIEAVYSSPLDRAVETAQAIAVPKSLSVYQRGNLGEVRFGDWTGKTLEELEGDERWRQWNQARSVVRAPEGELALEVQARMIHEITRIAAQHPDGTVALVSHADAIRCALSHLMGISLDHALRVQIYPASVSVVRMSGIWWDVLGVNVPASGIRCLLGGAHTAGK